jgi:LmbE family N-acetylglucosaminyl deacetylase
MILPSVRRAILGLALTALPASAQTWRETAGSLGSTARVLIIGAHPEDENNALIAWLSLGRNIETAYLSLTRGESGANVAGGERQSALGVVRTAELLAERRRDGARQYFTRAYDFGFTTSDSIVDAAWPRDSLMTDVVTIIRSFRPQIVISLFSDSTDGDASHRLAATLARDAFVAAATPGKYPMVAWEASRLYTRIDSGAAALAIDVGEFDRRTGKSYAELGAEIRRLQRTQPMMPGPPVGSVSRRFRLDQSRAGNAEGLFAGIDTTWARFHLARATETDPLVDSLVLAIRAAALLPADAAPGSVATALTTVIRRSIDVRLSYGCSEYNGVPGCGGMLGDLSLAVTRVRERATHALMGAAGIVIDGTAERELVAVGDSVPIDVAVFNGGESPLVVKRLAASTKGPPVRLVADSTPVIVAPGQVVHRTAPMRVAATSMHWWQLNGLLAGTMLHDIASRRGPISNVIAGEDRLESGGVEATITVAGVDVPFIERPIYVRGATGLRGDERHAVKGATRLSLLFERGAEYERAKLPIDRLLRVYVSTTRTSPETTTVMLNLPRGMRADSATRTVIVPPLGSRNVFFRVRGTMSPGGDTISASARSGGSTSTATVAGAQTSTVTVGGALGAYNYGIISRDYPHIPSQIYVRGSKLRIEAVDLKVPARLRVAYVKGTEDIQSSLGQLQINLQALEPSLLSVVDLSAFTTVLIGADAFANDALATTIPSLREFARNGGAVVILAGGDDIARSGLLPFPIAFDSVPRRVPSPSGALVANDVKSQLLTWPNVLSARDFEEWSTERARGIPSAVDARYRTVLSTGDPGQAANAPALITAAVGRGVIVYVPLSVDRELPAVTPGAARLFANLLAAGIKPGK